jgi:ribonuclease HI
LGIATNNQAEYNALLKALKIAKKYEADEVLCYLDSELVVKQLKGLYKIKNKKLQKFLSEIKKLEKGFKKISYEHVGRENKIISEADKLVNKKLDEANKK